MSIKFSAESTIVIPGGYKEKYDINVLPMHIVYGDESYDDGVNIDSDIILKRFDEKGEIPSTSACSIGEYQELFKKLTEDGSEVIHFSMSSIMSSTYRNATVAAEDFENVHVLDTGNITSGTGLMVIKAAEMREKGFSAKEIIRVSKENIGKIRSSFILDNLSFLAKGGRCPGVVAFGANILGIKPTIVVSNGTMSVGKKFRGKFDAGIQKYVKSLFEGTEEPDTSRAVIEYSNGITEAQLDMIKREIKKYCRFDEILTTCTSSTIVSHCGRNTVGVLFMVK